MSDIRYVAINEQDIEIFADSLNDTVERLLDEGNVIIDVSYNITEAMNYSALIEYTINDCLYYLEDDENKEVVEDDR